MSDFVDEDTNPNAMAPLHPAVIEWLEMRVKASRHYREGADVLADFERLLAVARGER